MQENQEMSQSDNLTEEQLNTMLQSLCDGLRNHGQVKETIKTSNPMVMSVLVNESTITELLRDNPNWSILLQNMMVLHHTMRYHGLHEFDFVHPDDSNPTPSYEGGE